MTSVIGRDTRQTGLGIAPSNGVIGATISGISLAEKLSESVVAELRQALHQHGVLFFRDQEIDDDLQAAFGYRFGGPYVHPYDRDPIGDTKIAEGEPTTMQYLTRSITTQPSPYGGFGLSTGWHTDAPFAPDPPYVGILRGVTLPPLGGDTLWAAMWAVYEDLSSAMQRLVEGLEAVQDGAAISVRGGLPLRDPFTHPMVIVDPVTSRRCLYVSPNYTTKVVGMSDDESSRLLSFLFTRMGCPDFQVRFHWEPGSVVMWNERATVHYGVGDYGKAARALYRVLVATDAPMEGVHA